MTYLRYTFFLIVSSMVVKIPLMALAYLLYAAINEGQLFYSWDSFFRTFISFEMIFFIPIYFIYLPLFLYNVRKKRTNPRYFRMDMGAIVFVFCALRLSPIAFLAPTVGIWMISFAVAYLMLTAEVHARLCLPDMLSPRKLD